MSTEKPQRRLELSESWRGPWESHIERLNPLLDEAGYPDEVEVDNVLRWRSITRRMEDALTELIQRQKHDK